MGGRRAAAAGTAARARINGMRRVLVAVLAVLVVVGAGCRTSDEKDTQRVEHRAGERDSLASTSEPARAWW